MRLLISSVLFFILSQSAFATENVRYYDIELVVFENLEENADNTEIWPRAVQLEVPENAATLGQKFKGELPPEYDPKLMFRLLSLDDYQLKDEAETLKESENYRILLHTGWRQAGLAKDIAIPVHFTHALAESAETPATENAAQPTQQGEALESQASTIATSKMAHLEGIVKVVLSRYLHLDVEMIYQKEGEDANVNMFDTSFLEERSDKEPIYYLHQTRRMRSKETHYIDHPKFSMLVRITPFKVETPAPAAAPKG